MADDNDDMEVSGTAARAHAYYREARDHSAEWRQEAREAYDMVAGKQWDETTLNELNKQQRPAVTFNRIARTINAICGTQVSNRQETRFIPRELGDVNVNEIMTGASDWVRDQCDAEDEDSDAFEDSAICGMGWTETRMDYELDPEGMVVIERSDPLEMYWDSTAKKRNISDARWVMRIVRMDPDVVESRWPDMLIDAQSDPWEGADDDDGSQREHVYPQDAYNNGQSGSYKRKKDLRVAQLQWAEYETVYRVGPTAERLSEKDFNKIKDKIEEAGIKYIEQQAPVWKQAFVAGGEVLEEGPCPFPEGPTFRAMTYKRDRNKNLWYGIVRAMMDPQRFGNKFFSQILDIINKGAKGGIMAETDAFEDQQDAEEKWARPDSIIFMRPGALGQGKVQPKPIVNLPHGLDRLMEFSLEGVHDVTGINLELLGMANREQAGVLEHQRKQAGLTIIAPLFDGLRRYRKEQGRVLLHFITKYISDERLIRITGDNGTQQYIPLLRDQRASTYDIIVDESPTSPNMKERVFGVLSELLPSLLKMGVPMPPSLLDYAPIPTKLSAEWKQMLQQPNPEEIQAQKAQMEQQLQQLGAENQSLKSRKEEAMAQIELKRAQAEADLGLERMKLDAEIQLEREKAIAQGELQRDKESANINLQQMKMQGQFELERRKSVADSDVSQNEALSKAFNEALSDGKTITELLDGGRSIQVQRGENGEIIGAVVNQAGRSKQMQIVRDENGEILGAESIN